MRFYENIKPGTKFMEECYGEIMNFTATTQTYIGYVDIRGKRCRQFSWTAMNEMSGVETEFLITEGYEHYGPDIYDGWI